MKTLRVLAITALTAALPFMASAHSEKNSGKHLGWFNFKGHINWNMPKAGQGTVSAVSGTGFTITTEQNQSFTVDTTNAKISNLTGTTLSLSNIHIGDKVEIKGSGSGNQITAKTVLVTPANTHAASGSGKVTAVNGSQITVQQNAHGIISSFLVNTSSSTVVNNQNNSTTTTASISVGSKITVSGLWDEIQNLLNAIKIKIK